MYEQAGNTGNSIVGAMVGSKSRNFIRRRIHVRPLDAIFPHGLHVELMKVDVQGYECEVFRGMRELLASQQVRKIHFEVWAEGLAAQNCSTEQLVDTLQADGYELCISGADLTASKASNMPRVISGGAGDTASNPLTPSAKSKHLFDCLKQNPPPYPPTRTQVTSSSSSPPFPTGGEWDHPPLKGWPRRSTPPQPTHPHTRHHHLRHHPSPQGESGTTPP